MRHGNETSEAIHSGAPINDLKAHLCANRTLKNFYGAQRNLEEHAFTHSAKVALLTSYTLDFLPPLLKVDLALSDIRCAIYKPHFNQFRQEILDARSGLYRFDPDMAIIGFNLEDVFPDATSRFPLLSGAEQAQLAHDVNGLYESLAQTFRRHAARNSALLLQDLIPPFQSFDPLLRGAGSVHNIVRNMNAALHELCSKLPNTYVMEYARVVEEHGSRSWTDPRTYYTARIPVAQQNWLHLSEAYAKYIRALIGAEVKCVILDLDNTLWGGVLGEDGPDGIQIGETYPGNVFRRFQEYLLSLYASGYILAISSKNNADDVLEVLRNHPSMVLREQHFAAIRANWNSKEQNIREISREIRISPDHMLFIDDNPLEIQKVKTAIPEVRCLQIVSPPLDFVRQVEQERCIGKLLVTGEDKDRGRQYFEDRMRREFRQATGTIEDFYRSLGQRLTIHINNERHRSRIAQLTQRTNQFNMTTIRLTESDVEQMMNRSDYWLVTADLADCFGESGTIAYMQVRKFDRSWILENLLMSCRVLGRTVEESLLDYLCERARAEGADIVLATYAPSKKNAPFADFYLRNGFIETETGTGGEKRYRRRLADERARESFVEIAELSSGA